VKTTNTKKLRTCRSEGYNFIFNKTNGNFARWGKTLEDDPQVAPMNEILDCEITTICHGVPNKDGIKTPCAFCYKSNTPKGKNMSFETFKGIIDKMPWTLQVAFGADSECTSNPDIWKMMAYCRKKDIVPNITVANISDETADELTKYCGAVAVSRYFNKDICYDSVKKLTDRGMKQINIHALVSNETYDLVCAFDVIEHVADDYLACSEMKRVCKTGGIVLVTVPAFSSLWSHHDVINHHFKRYKTNELKQLFSKNGEIQFLSYFNSWLFIPIWLIRTISNKFPNLFKRDGSGSDHSMFKLGFLNTVLYYLFLSENAFLKNKISLPFGVSALVSWRK
jgi:SAM-dependent methyltransferase